MSQQSSIFNYGGWYRGVNAASIIWLPVNMRKVQLATGTPWFGSRYLILGRTVNDLTILDMEDYLCRLSVKGVWREGGIRYVDGDGDEERRASALASSSGLSVQRVVEDWPLLLLMLILILFLNWLRTMHSVFRILTFHQRRNHTIRKLSVLQ
jgi:hypothetical protein